jgi:hypothetical protein
LDESRGKGATQSRKFDIVIFASQQLMHLSRHGKEEPEHQPWLSVTPFYSHYSHR